MVSWWWLVVEFVVLVGLGVVNRGATRALGIADALEDPAKARLELARRWRVSLEALRYRYGPN